MRRAKRDPVTSTTYGGGSDFYYDLYKRADARAEEYFEKYRRVSDELHQRKMNEVKQRQSTEPLTEAELNEMSRWPAQRVKQWVKAASRMARQKSGGDLSAMKQAYEWVRGNMLTPEETIDTEETV